MSEGILDDQELTYQIAASSSEECAARLAILLSDQDLTDSKLLEIGKLFFGPDFKLDLNPCAPDEAADRALAELEAEADAAASEQDLVAILERRGSTRLL